MTDYVALSEVAELVGGGTPSRSNPAFFGGSIDWVTPSDLPPIGQIMELGSVQEKLSQQGLASSSARLIVPPAVLFSSRATIGKIAVADRPYTTNQGFVSILPKAGVLEPWFLAYFLRFKTPEILLLAGETTYKEISRGKLRYFRIWLPPFVEQRRIVVRIQQCLKRVREIERLQAESLAEASASRASALASIFEELAGRFPKVEIASVTVDSAYGTNHKCNTSALGTPVLRIPNVQDGAIDTSDLKYAVFGERERRKVVLIPGDLLIVRTNGSPGLVGRCAVFELDKEYGYASYLIRFRLDQEKCAPKYLSCYLASTLGRDAISSIRRTSAGQFNINAENIGRITFPLPPLDEQLTLASHMEAVSRAVGRMLREKHTDLESTEHLTESILRKAFAGDL